MKKKFILTVVTFLMVIMTSSAETVFAVPNEPTLQEVTQNIQECDSKIEYNMDKLNTYKEQIIEKENEISDSEKQLTVSEEEIKSKEQQLEDRLNLIQINGGIESTPMRYLNALLSSDNILDAINNVNQISKICTSDKKLVKEAKEAKENITKTKQNIEKENENLKKDKDDVEKAIKALEDEKTKLLEYVQENSNILNTGTGISVPITLPSDISGQAKAIIEESEKYLGVPYVWGGTSPEGFDCSGLMQYAFKSQGIDIPRTSEEQQKYLTTINMSEIKPGDLVFNKTSDSTHVGMYIGNDMYIQAPHTGDFVKISKLSESNMKYVGRILN